MWQDDPPAAAACLYSTALLALSLESDRRQNGDGASGSEAMVLAQQRRLTSIDVKRKPSLRAKRSNPSRRAKKVWIASLRSQ
jgi:hypothetical protein